MPKLKLKRNIPLYRKMWKNYHRFVFIFLIINRPVAKIYLSTCFALLLIAYNFGGVYLQIFNYLAAFYILYLILSAIRLLFSYFRIMSVYEAEQNKMAEFIFEFDEEGIRYDLGHTQSNRPWSRYEYYVERKEFIYLLAKNRRVLEIISKEYLGIENFELIQVFIKKHCVPFRKFM